MDRELKHHTKWPGVCFEAPDDLLFFVEYEKVMTLFSPDGALPIFEVKGDQELSLADLSLLFRHACRVHPDKVAEAVKNYRTLVRSLFTYTYQNTDYSLKPTCAVSK